jgi:hypothetical protein
LPKVTKNQKWKMGWSKHMLWTAFKKSYYLFDKWKIVS